MKRLQLLENMSKATVEIFRTNIGDKTSADVVVKVLSALFPGTKFNVDLHDADRILRIEGELSNKHEVVRVANSLGFFCNAIDD